MLQNNGARLNIWKTLERPFDYTTFCAKCEELSVKPMTQIDFAQKVGLLLAAKDAYPELEIEQAYVMYAMEASSYGTVSGIVGGVAGPGTNYIDNTPTQRVTSTTSESLAVMQAINEQRSCCGGGQVK